MTPKEFDIKQRISLGFVVWIAIISFSLGGIYTRIIDQAKDIQASRNYTQQEVDGLRADWERDRKSQEKRLEKLETK